MGRGEAQRGRRRGGGEAASAAAIGDDGQGPLEGLPGRRPEVLLGAARGSGSAARSTVIGRLFLVFCLPRWAASIMTYIVAGSAPKCKRARGVTAQLGRARQCADRQRQRQARHPGSPRATPVGRRRLWRHLDGRRTSIGRRSAGGRSASPARPWRAQHAPDGPSTRQSSGTAPRSTTHREHRETLLRIMPRAGNHNT